ncbi:hypothetical protein V8E55_005782 [Tylopilus felleus]
MHIVRRFVERKKDSIHSRIAYMALRGTDRRGWIQCRTCFGTHNTSEAFWTNVAVNADRSWTWMVCNQVGFYQARPPTGQLLGSCKPHTTRCVYSTSRVR